MVFWTESKVLKYTIGPQSSGMCQNYHSFPMLNAPASFGKMPWFLPAPGCARLTFSVSVRKQNVSEDIPWSAQRSGVGLLPFPKLSMPMDHEYWSSPQQKMDKMSLLWGACGFWRAVEGHGKPQLPPPAKPPSGWDPSHCQPLLCSQGLYCQESGANHQQCALIPAFLMG